MAYAQTSSGPQNEVLKLQDEITREVNTDAEHIATSVFGKVGTQPDVQKVTDDQLNSRYRQAYLTNDRAWLTQEAQRDPDQFIKVARRIGVMKPEELGQVLPQQPPQPPPPPPPVPAPAPLPPPGVTPVPAIPPSPGMNLGAIAQPAQPVPMTVPPVTQG
jgi:hypothetical protein